MDSSVSDVYDRKDHIKVEDTLIPENNFSSMNGYICFVTSSFCCFFYNVSTLENFLFS